MEEAFITYRFPLTEVLPGAEAAADYLHLDDAEHPAYAFMLSKLDELRRSVYEAVGGYVQCHVQSLNLQEGTVAVSRKVLTADGCEAVADAVLHVNRQVAAYLRRSERVALFACTAGTVFSEQYKAYSRQGDYLEAYITDALGSLTVENAMDRIQAALETGCKRRGESVSNRYSPGYCNWPLIDQQALFGLIGANPTGIELTDTCLMRPVKSVSGIIGIGQQVRKREYGCAVCANQECIYRKIMHHTK